MRSANAASGKPEPPSFEDTFSSLLLAIVGRRRAILLCDPERSRRIGLLARLARHVEADGTLVLTVGASPGATIEDLVEAAGCALLGRSDLPDSFMELVERLDVRLEAAGAGVLMVEDAGSLPTDTLSDLLALSGDTTESGARIQVLLAGDAGLERKLEQGGLLDPLLAVGTVIRQDSPDPSPDGRAADATPELPGPMADWIAARPTDGPAALRTGVAKPKEVRSRGSTLTGWLALLLVASVAGTLLWFLWLKGEPPGWLVDAVPRQVGQAARDLADLAAPDDPLPPSSPPNEPDLSPRQAPPPADAPAPTLPVPEVSEEAVPDPIGTPMPPSPSTPAVGSPSEPPIVEDAAPPDTPLPDAPDPTSLPASGEAMEPVTDGEVVAALEPRLPTPPELPPSALPAEGEAGTAAPAPADTDAAEPTSQLVRDLLDKARGQIAARRLTTPQSDNALETLIAVEEVSPGDPDVARLRREMVSTYRRWAGTAERRGAWPLARVYYQRALRVDPGNRAVTELLDGLDARRGRGQAAVPTAPAAEPAVEREPQRGDEPPPPRLR